MQRIKLTGMIFLILSAVIFAGNNDVQEKLRAEKQYIEDFCSGYIPDYNNLGVICKNSE